MKSSLLVAALLVSALRGASGQSSPPTFKPSDSAVIKLQEFWHNRDVHFVCLYGDRTDSLLTATRVETASRFSVLVRRACRGAVSFAAFRRDEESTTERKMLHYMQEHNIEVAVLVLGFTADTSGTQTVLHKVLFRPK